MRAAIRSSTQEQACVTGDAREQELVVVGVQRNVLAAHAVDVVLLESILRPPDSSVVSAGKPVKTCARVRRNRVCINNAST